MTKELTIDELKKKRKHHKKRVEHYDKKIENLEAKKKRIGFKHYD